MVRFCRQFWLVGFRGLRWILFVSAVGLVGWEDFCIRVMFSHFRVFLPISCALLVVEMLLIMVTGISSWMWDNHFLFKMAILHWKTVFRFFGFFVLRMLWRCIFVLDICWIHQFSSWIGLISCSMASRLLRSLSSSAS